MKDKFQEIVSEETQQYPEAFISALVKWNDREKAPIHSAVAERQLKNLWKRPSC